MGLPHSFPGFLLSLVGVQILQRRDSLQSRQKGLFQAQDFGSQGQDSEQLVLGKPRRPTARMRSRDGPAAEPVSQELGKHFLPRRMVASTRAHKQDGASQVGLLVKNLSMQET